MKKIKVIVSDFHIGKGERLPDGRVNEMEDFFFGSKFVELVNYYGSRLFEDYEVEIIANGDFFNTLSVDYHRNFTERITEEVSVEKMKQIFKGHSEVFDSLAEFCLQPKNQLAFIVGNHDASLLWERVQEMLKERISKHVKFHPESYTFDGVFVAHGHQYEFLNHFNTRDFSYRDQDGQEALRLPWGSYFVLNVISPAKKKRPYIDKVKPFRKYLRWCFFNEFIFFWKIIFKLVEFWSRNRLHRDPQRRREFVLSVRRILDAATHKSMNRAAEDILINTSYKIVIFGHSHSAEYRNLGVHGEYYNTGTWTEVVSFDIARFGRNVDLTYVLIEYIDRRPRASLKRWIGIHRVVEDVLM